MVRILVERLAGTDDIPLPERATSGASGVDLRAAVLSDTVLAPGATALVPTGIRVSIPRGWEWQIRPRSGNALRYGVTVLNTPGTVDSDYRGEVMVILANLGSGSFTVRRGDRIAQAVLSAVAEPEFVSVDSLDETERGSGGFGHTGIG